MATVETLYDLEDFRKVTKSASGRIGYILSGILVLVCGCGPSADDIIAKAEKKVDDGRFMEAYHDYSTVIDRFPNHSNAYVYRSYVLSEMKRDDDAVEDMSTAIEMDEGYIDYYFQRAWLYMKMGRMDKGLDDIDRALTCTTVSNLFFNNNINRAISGVYSLKGQILAAQGDVKGALEWYRKSIRKDENNAVPYRLRSNLFKREGRFKESESDSDKADELEEKYPDR